MEIGVSTWSFSRTVKSGGMSQLDVVDAVADAGFGCIEFSHFLLPDGDDHTEFAHRARERCDNRGLRVLCYSIAADFINGSGGDLDAEVIRLRSEVDIAEILGAPLMRHDVGHRNIPTTYTPRYSFDSFLPRLANGVRATTEYAQSKGIRTCSENHGYFVQDSDRMEALVNEVDHPNYGVLLDIGNFICADEDPAVATGKLLPYVFHVHAKDFYLRSGMLPDPGDGWSLTRAGNRFRGSIIGHGNVPVLQCLRLIRGSGYDGTFSIEFEGFEEPVEGISQGRDNLVRLWESV